MFKTNQFELEQKLKKVEMESKENLNLKKNVARLNQLKKSFEEQNIKLSNNEKQLKKKLYEKKQEYLSKEENYQKRIDKLNEIISNQKEQLQNLNVNSMIKPPQIHSSNSTKNSNVHYEHLTKKQIQSRSTSNINNNIEKMLHHKMGVNIKNIPLHNNNNNVNSNNNMNSLCSNSNNKNNISCDKSFNSGSNNNNNSSSNNNNNQNMNKAQNDSIIVNKKHEDFLRKQDFYPNNKKTKHSSYNIKNNNNNNPSLNKVTHLNEFHFQPLGSNCSSTNNKNKNQRSKHGKKKGHNRHKSLENAVKFLRNKNELIFKDFIINGNANNGNYGSNNMHITNSQGTGNNNNNNIHINRNNLNNLHNIHKINSCRNKSGHRSTHNNSNHKKPMVGVVNNINIYTTTLKQDNHNVYVKSNVGEGSIKGNKESSLIKCEGNTNTNSSSSNRNYYAAQGFNFVKISKVKNKTCNSTS